MGLNHLVGGAIPKEESAHRVSVAHYFKQLGGNPECLLVFVPSGYASESLANFAFKFVDLRLGRASGRNVLRHCNIALQKPPPLLESEREIMGIT